MQGHRNRYCFHVPGTLSANISITWTACADGRIKHISAGGTATDDFTLVITTLEG